MNIRLSRLVSTYKNLRRDPLLTLLITPSLTNEVEPCFFLLRWFLPVALFFRYLLHADKGIQLLFEGSFYIVLLIFILYLCLSEIEFHKLKNRVNASAHEWRTFTSYFTFGDVGFITLFFILSNSPRSDIPYLYVIPIVWSIMYMPLRNNLFALICVSILFAFGSTISIYQSSGRVDLAELLLIFMPKLIFLPIIVLYLLWVHVKLKLSENVIKALFDKSPAGISFIGQKKSKKYNPPEEMQILKLNEAQQTLTPNAKPVRQSCRKEFMSFSATQDSVCSWCPASEVLDGDVPFRRSLTKTIYKPSPESIQEISFSDASASPCIDEKDEIIAAVKFVKDVTPQVYSAYLASELFLFQDEAAVLNKTAEYFRKMFKSHDAKIAKYRHDNNQFNIVAQATSLQPVGSSCNDGPISISMQTLSILESCPSEVDIIQEIAEINKSDCLFWDDYCLPESPNPYIKDIARSFNLSSGLIIPIKAHNTFWGLILINRVTPTNEFQKLTQFDVLQAQLASQMTALALERVQLLVEKEQSQIKEEQTWRLISSGIAHSIGNPVSAIQGALSNFNDTLSNKSLTKNVEEMLEDVHSNLLLINELVFKIRSFEKEIKLNVSRVILNDLLTKSVGQMSRALPTIKVTYDLSVPPIEIKADAVLLTTAIQEITKNSLQFLDNLEKGELIIKTYAGDDSCRIEIIDNGPGFKGVDMSLVFEPFYTKTEHGTGLGLAIAKRNIDAHSGKISADNVTDANGAKIVITLPLNS